MKYPLTVSRYFKNAADVAAAVPPNRPRPQEPFVTISRECGAGGRALAEALTARFAKEKEPLFSNWQVFDKNLCERVAADPELHVSLKTLLDEEYHTGVDGFLRGVLADASPQMKVDHHMFRTVRTVCVLGKAIVLGRSGAMITRDLPLGVHVRLVSSRKARIERLRRQNGLSAAETAKFVDQKDASRARRIKSYSNKDINDPLLYDCVWNADSVSYDAMAASLVALVRQRASRR